MYVLKLLSLFVDDYCTSAAVCQSIHQREHYDEQTLREVDDQQLSEIQGHADGEVDDQQL